MTSDRTSDADGAEAPAGTGAGTLSTLIGAEMLNWSDLRPVDGRPASGGPVAATLLDSILGTGDSVLIAGPHSVELIEQAANRVAALDVLVRSAPDAEELAALLVDRPVRVFCGALDRFGPGHGENSYDVVVALDGLPRLVGPDTPVLTWTEALTALRDRLAPGGRLVVAAANPFGIERMVRPDPTVTVPRDEAWPRDVGGAVEAPAGLRAVEAAMAAAQLAPSRTYAAYPDLTNAQVAFADATGPIAGAVIARTIVADFTGPTLADPYRTANDVVGVGLGNELAAGWFLVAGGTELPEVLPAGALPEGPGELLEEILLTALRIDDHAALRRTVPHYADWLRDQDAATAAAAAPDNLLFDGTTYRLFADGGAAAAGTGDALVVAQLARFVRRSLAAGSRQPWSVGSTPRDLTARLASIAAITVDDDLWAAVTVSDDMVRPQGSAEQLATIARLSHELAVANTQVAWLEQQLQKLRGSRAYRLGMAMMNPARVVYRRVRKGIR